MYSPVNACIYCGRTNDNLTREHILPYSLGGSLVLPRASCSEHAALTSRIEREVARDAYGFQRAEMGARTRRPGAHAKLLDARVELGGETFDGKKVKVPVRLRDIPPVPLFIRMSAPGFLRGEPPDSKGGWRNQFAPKAANALTPLRERLGLKGLFGPVSTMDVTAFFRLLAKVGHAFAVAERGLGSFEPVLLPLILAEPVSAWHYIGEHDPPRPQGPSALLLREEMVNGDNWLLVDISIHMFPDMPMYQVVAGKVTE